MIERKTDRQTETEAGRERRRGDRERVCVCVCERERERERERDSGVRLNISENIGFHAVRPYNRLYSGNVV